VSVDGRARRIVWIRRAVQIASTLLFLWLLLGTRFEAGGKPSSLLRLYFDIDPLVLIATWLATHQITGLSLLALITLALTMILGRVFCGWLCPLGAIHNALSWLKVRRRALRMKRDGFSPWQRSKYFLLLALIAMAFFGAHWIGVFDPASLLYRSVALTALPATQFAVEAGSDTVYLSDPHLGPLHLRALTEPVYGFFRDHLFHDGRQLFQGGGLILFIFLAALLLNLLRPRFWCRYICPLGGLLGLFARRTTLRLAHNGKCADCRLCLANCPAAAQPEREGEWLAAECFGCWNCVAVCDQDAIDFRWELPWRKPDAGKVDLKRRAVLGALGAGVGGLFLMRISPAAHGETYNPELIRPPGSLPEREFLQRCVQCGMCMKVCPTNALQPALGQAGLEGLWSPVLVPAVGYCEYECKLCGDVCPTEAIEPLPLEEKKPFKLGLATIDTTRCLPYAYGRECIVCEEHCPIPTKAIYFVEEEVRLRDGSRRTLKQPRVDPDLCNGCGICETMCPFQDLAAVRVTSAGETRHPGNQPMLPGGPSLAPLPTGEENADPYGY
jgi:polyferredoxin